MKRKKIGFWGKIGTGAAILVSVGFAFGAIALGKKLFEIRNNPPADEPTPTITVNGTLNDSLKEVTGDGIMTISEDITLTVNDGGETVLGADGMKNITIDGENKGSITATGGKESIIHAVNGATLTFKNLTINDDTENRDKAYLDYLYFGGTLTFENCVFTDSIYLKQDVTATFKDCTFNSVHSRYYSVWIGDGSASFENCTFKGYRGLKIHEFAKENEMEETKSVTVENCLFDKLSEKPGVALGTLDKDTVINITRSIFDGCVAWDTEGSLTGVDGMYECDTPLSDFTFIQNNNIVKNTRYKITYQAIMDGKAASVPEVMYLADGEYPTHFKAGETVTISDLQFVHYDSHTDYEFKGWYLDKACTQAFDGVITTNGNITLYAKISVAYWTDNY